MDTHGTRRRTPVRRLVAITAICAIAGRARAVEPLSAAPQDLTLPPGGSYETTLWVPAGDFVDLRVRQISGVVRVTVEPAVARSPRRPPTPRLDDAGVGSQIRVPLVADLARRYRVRVVSADPRLPVRIVIWLAALRPTRPGDRTDALAERTYAQAQQLRRTRHTAAQTAALAAYRQAEGLAARLGDRSLERRALIGEARTLLFELGDYRAALAVARRAVALPAPRADDPRALPDVPFEALAWKTLSAADAVLARYRDAVAAARTALGLYRRIGDRYWQGVLLGNLGYVDLELGETERALSAVHAALRIARIERDGRGVGFSLGALAAIHQARGEYQAALDTDRRALAQFRLTPDPDQAGQIWANLADLYADLGASGQERDALHKALALLGKERDAENESAVLDSLGGLDLREGRDVAAGRALRQALRIARRDHLPREQADAQRGIARWDAGHGNLAAALAANAAGLVAAARTHEVAARAALLQQRGDLSWSLHRPAAALADYRRALRDWLSIPDAEQAALARASIARLHWHQGKIRRAYREIREAIAVFDVSRDRLRGRVLRDSFFASRHAYYDLAVRIALRLERRGGRNATAQAWTWVERAKARSLLDAIREQDRFAERPIPAAWVARDSAIERAIDAREQAMAASLGSPGQSGALRHDARVLRRLTVDQETLDARERATAAGAGALRADSQPPSLRAVQRAVTGPDTALLEYWIGPRWIYRWQIRRGVIREARIAPSSAVTAAIRVFRDALLARGRHPPDEGYRAYRRRIAQADRIVRTEARLLGHWLIPRSLPGRVRRLVIVPDGPLYSLPFAALRDRAHQYLVSRYEIAEEPSAAAALQLVTVSHSLRGRDRVVVFGDPVYNRDDPRMRTAPTPAAQVGNAGRARHRTVRGRGFAVAVNELPRLPSSAAEARAIAAAWAPRPSRVYLGFQATPNRVVHLDWQRLRAVDFATHAFVSRRDPQLTGIVLSNYAADGVRRDGILWLDDIYRLQASVPLVTLSECDSASGRDVPGSGLSSLATAFLYAGAWGVVGSLWQVDDAAASRLMPILYRHWLRDHESPPAALRAAQQRLIANPRESAPFFWAGLVFEGDWRRTRAR